MLNGWGCYVLTEASYVNAFFSHDEYIDFFAENSANLAEIRETPGPKQPTGGTTTLTDWHWLRVGRVASARNLSGVFLFAIVIPGFDSAS
jgi:hypothetical protein